MPGVVREEDVYLGDGVYVAYDGWQVRLYATDGSTITAAVYLAPAVLAGLLGWLALHLPNQMTQALAAAEAKRKP